MATSVVMPALEMAQETGKIVSWVKKEGDSVSKGDILLEVETDKAVVFKWFHYQKNNCRNECEICQCAGDVVTDSPGRS